MSLSTWFRDYLYIPMGGSRLGVQRTYLNLVIVFFLCGLWHGAAWTFVAWGLFHGLFLALERTKWGDVLKRAWPPIRHIYTVAVFGAGWVLFRSESIERAGAYYASLLGMANATDARYGPGTYFNPLVLTILICGIAFSIPLLPRLRKCMAGQGETKMNGLSQLAGALLLLFIFFLSVLPLASGTYNPFIYFRF